MPAYILSTMLEIFYRRVHKNGIEVIIEDKVEKECFITLEIGKYEGPRSFPGRDYIMTQYTHAYTCMCSVFIHV